MALQRYSTFYLGDQMFGIDILYVREINRNLDLTEVQQAPTFVEGLINLRGQIVTVINLNKRLNRQEAYDHNQAYNVILKTEQELSPIRDREDRHDIHGVSDIVGLMVNEIGDVVSVDSSEINAPPANIGEVDGQFLMGVIKQDDTLIGVLNVQKILDHHSNLN